MSSEDNLGLQNVAEEIPAILLREGLWSDAPPDPPTMRGISLPLWNEWCIATHQTFRTGKRALRASTEADAITFYQWYFQAKGVIDLVKDFDIPRELIPLILDLRTQHSEEGCRRILSFAAAVREPRGAVIALSRIRYLMELAHGRQPHLKGMMAGLVKRALSAVGWWPPHTTTDV